MQYLRMFWLKFALKIYLICGRFNLFKTKPTQL